MWKKRKTRFRYGIFFLFGVGNRTISVWIRRKLFHVFHIFRFILIFSTLQIRILWKTYPSRIRTLMLSIVSANEGSSAIICVILLQAEIAVVWSFRSNRIAILL